VDEGRLTTTLTDLVVPLLAKELSQDFIKIRQDYGTKTLERASSGKFVETFVQCLQQVATGAYDAKPNVDGYLSSKVESEASLPDGLRICAARIARSIYTLRNKRNIAHKNEIDPNTFDLAHVHQGAAWIMAELIRNASGITMQEAGAVIELIQAPVGSLVEEIEGLRLIHADVSIRTELLILLHSYYPSLASTSEILASLSRRDAATVQKRLRELFRAKWVHGDSKAGFRLTLAGHQAATAELRKLQV
jgi:hypothetical protein